MIKLLRTGDYSLAETEHNIKILRLDQSNFAWIKAEGIGEILVTSLKQHAIEEVLSIGVYRLYSVLDEPKLTDLIHLELFVGKRKWQGYLLPTGLPTPKSLKKRIIPTKETITKINVRI